MHRVRSYRRRDGTRVRSHYRRRRRGTTRRRSSTLRSNKRENSGLLLLSGLGALMLLGLIVEFIQQRPVLSAVIAVAMVTIGLCVLLVVQKARARRAAELAERDRDIATTDGMTGPEFEQWFARVLMASGFSQVTVRGGRDDRGADIIAIAPDGRRTVVQCKRYSAKNRVGSGVIQQFAGTCRTIHRGEICMIVTNGWFAEGDGVQLARELDILLVDRSALTAWASTGSPPAWLARRWQRCQQAA